MSTDRPDVLSEQLLCRICAEHVEMPGMRLSRKQAQRLWESMRRLVFRSWSSS